MTLITVIAETATTAIVVGTHHAAPRMESGYPLVDAFMPLGQLKCVCGRGSGTPSSVMSTFSL